ncbi:efflux RND transporter periplasmic adaptor subunit [Fusobacterium sp. PH5-44]|uniref:efflux RND transporter periplasmic adaptor subunit n=1 Tax=unclassified Fusobacterium TaxID=2648384 RepID=UPI003D1AC7F6
MKKLIGLITIVIAIFLTSCGSKEEAKVEKKTVKQIRTEPITKRTLSTTFTSDAVLEPKGKIDHKTEAGGTIKAIYKRNGEFVKKGEVVMELTDASTEAAYKSAKATYNVASNNYSKFRQLFNKKLVSYLEYAPYENNFLTAKAAYESAKSDYEKLLGKAPIDGVVGNLFDKVGNKIEKEKVLFTILDDTQMETYIGFPAEWLSGIKLDQEIVIKIQALGNGEFRGKIVEINPIAESDTKKFRVKVAVDNENAKIKDGMYGFVTMDVGSHEVLSVSDESIFVRNLLNYVYKVGRNEDGEQIVTRIEVKTGATNLPYTEISSDKLKEGDIIVKEGLFGLDDGSLVEEVK